MKERYLTYALAIGAILCATSGLNRCERSDEEVANYIDSSYSPEVYLKYRQIGDQYGAIAADYWLNTYSPYANREYHELMSTFDQELLNEQILPAKAANFAVKRDPDRDTLIQVEYLKLRAKRPELERRTELSERIKDMSPWLLGAIVLGFLAKKLYERNEEIG